MNAAAARLEPHRAEPFSKAYADAGTPLGPRDSWPAALETLVGVMLNSDQPMLIGWGENLVGLYNDAHAALIGDKHPAAFGRPLFEVRTAASDFAEARFRAALRGHRSRIDGLVVPVTRGGRVVSAWFDISYTPIPLGDAIGGVLCMSTETTDVVRAQQRRAALLELSDRSRDADDPSLIVAAGVEALGRALAANRVGYGEVQADGDTILLDTSYVDGVAPLHGVFPLESFGPDNIAAQRRGETVVHEDVRLAAGADFATWEAIETRAVVSAPLIRDGRLRATIYVNFRAAHAWSADEVSLIEEVGDRIWDSLERARAEAGLRRAQRSLSAIFEASSEGLTLCRLMTDESGRAVDYQVLDVNPAHRRLTGATRERMLAKPVSQIAPPIDPRWISTAEAAVRSGRPQTFEVRSGVTGRWLDIHVSPVGEDLFAQTFIDVTERRDAEDYRRRLVEEMNHRVMNNFQMVAGVLDLQARRSEAAEVKAALHDAVRRVRSLAELHQSLATSPESGDVDMRLYLSTLCEKLRATIDDPTRITLKVSAREARLESGVAVPLGFVVNELVTNAIKYAFPEPAGGEISVRLEGGDGGDIRLIIADGGKGLPAAVDAKGTGLGMRLVHAFLSQIGATLTKLHDRGLTYVISVPPRDAAATRRPP